MSQAEGTMALIRFMGESTIFSFEFQQSLMFKSTMRLALFDLDNTLLK